MSGARTPRVRICRMSNVLKIKVYNAIGQPEAAHYDGWHNLTNYCQPRHRIGWPEGIDM
jgi:hypothetical protein